MFVKLIVNKVFFLHTKMFCLTAKKYIEKVNVGIYKEGIYDHVSEEENKSTK